MKELSNKLRLKRRWIGGLCLLVVVLAVAWLVLASREPSYQGKTLTEWQDEMIQAYYDWPESTREEQLVQTYRIPMKAMGTNVFPVLMQQLQVKDSFLRREGRELYFMSGGSGSPPMRAAWYSRIAAACSLAALEEQGLAAMPELLRLAQAKDYEIRSGAREALAMMGVNSKEYLGLLQVALESGSKSDRDNAIACLMMLKGKAKPLLPHLQEIELTKGNFIKGLGAAIEAVSR